MEQPSYEIESEQLFSKSKIWQLNRDFYQFNGIKAFSDDLVPHHLTSNAFVGKTYAELIFGFLKDLASKGQTQEIVYILELGAGHGRLAYLVLKQLEELAQGSNETLPPFCYVLSDIVEGNLSYFQNHPQLQTYIQDGILDVSYYDAIGDQSLYLRQANKSINHQELTQPIIAIANYFFDSIPNELFFVKNKKASICSVSLSSPDNPIDLNPEELIKNLELNYSYAQVDIPFYDDPAVNNVFEGYQQLATDTYVFFPELGMQCLRHLKELSTKGLLLLSMDKGFHEMLDLEHRKEPDFVTHGSFSIWVNYHALGAYCEQLDGMAMFPELSTFHLDLGALLFLSDSPSYYHTIEAFQKFVNDFGPDDFNSLKQLSYFNNSRLKVKELIALFRLSAYDSTFFIKLLPQLKQVAKAITFNERKRIGETMHKVWSMYFSIGESFDLPYEMAGVFYDLGFYNDALTYFQHSSTLHGDKPDTYYNIAMSYYQLRQDKQLAKTIAEAKYKFPNYALLDNLDNLNLS